MSDLRSSSQSFDIVLERVANMQGDVSEIKNSVKCLDECQHRFERDYLQEHAKVVQESNAAHRRLDEFEKRMKERNADFEYRMTERSKESAALRVQMTAIQESMTPLIAAYRVLAFLGGALGLSVIALIWSLITGQVKLVF